MSKSAEQETLEMLVVSAGLEWLKAQQEELQTGRLTRAVFDDPKSSLADRSEALAQSKYSTHLAADAENKLVQTLTRLENTIRRSEDKP